MEPTKLYLADQVFERIEEDILNGRYAYGDILSENTLAADLGVSRTPVREALNRLATEGLVQVLSKRGTMVIGIQQQDVAAMYEVRLRVEGLAARIAAESGSPDHVQRMQEILTLQALNVEQNNADRLKILDTDFHQEIYAMCQNAYLENLLRDLHHRLQRFRRQSVTVHKRSVQAFKEHNAIFDAIAEHKPVEAEQAMISHIHAAWENIQREYSESGLWK